MRRLLCFILAGYLLICAVNATRLYVKPTTFYAYDRDVKLICSDVSHNTGLIKNITKISIDRMQSDGAWETIADIEHSTSTTFHIFRPDFTITGTVEDVLTSHLTIDWPVMSPDKFGKYRCLASGHTVRGMLATESSPELDVKGLKNDSHLFEFIALSKRSVLKHVDEDLAKDLRNMEDIAVKMLNYEFLQSLSNLFSEIETWLSALGSSTVKNFTSILTSTPTVDTSLWPEGSFSLLMPVSLCPLNPPKWKTGFLKQRTEDNVTFTSLPGQHMALPSSADKYIYQQFCSLDSSSDRKRPWPPGSYCINRYTDACPSGFVSDVLRYDLNNSFSSPSYGELPRGGYNDMSYHRIYYCCRHDGNATDPISLPWSKPFYLYRHQGTCQQVMNMDVISDTFLLQTSDDSGGDRWLNYDTEYRPDFSIAPIEANLCYYLRTKF